MPWALSKEVIFTKIQVRGSGLCPLPVLGARTFPEFLRLPSSPHLVQTEQVLQNSLQCFPPAAKNPRLSPEDTRLHLILLLPNLRQFSSDFHQGQLLEI